VKVGPPFTEPVRLLVMLLPHVAKQDCFALKGGTAINLFLRDMSRLGDDVKGSQIDYHEKPVMFCSAEKIMSDKNPSFRNC